MVRNRLIVNMQGENLFARVYELRMELMKGREDYCCGNIFRYAAFIYTRACKWFGTRLEGLSDVIQLRAMMWVAFCEVKEIFGIVFC